MLQLKTPYLFTYGTLLPEIPCRASSIMKKISKPIAKGYTMGTLLKPDYYPALVPHKRGRIVKGRVMKLKNPNKAMKFLDSYEQAYCGEREYIRKIILVQTPNNLIPCITYSYNHKHPSFSIIKKGDFKIFIKRFKCGATLPFLSCH